MCRLIKVCSNGGATYIISEIKVKHNIADSPYISHEIINQKHIFTFSTSLKPPAGDTYYARRFPKLRPS